VLQQLGLGAAEAIAFEDSANGLRAARAAGLPCIVTPTAYTADEDYAAATVVLRDLDTAPQAPGTVVTLAELRAWHARVHGDPASRPDSATGFTSFASLTPPR
jgi:hypothetical protein